MPAENARLQRALQHLRQTFRAQSFRTEPDDGSRYKVILKRVREIVSAGGSPFDDPDFSTFFRFEVSREKAIRYLGKAPQHVESSRKFIRAVVRICGGTVGPDGAIDLAGARFSNRSGLKIGLTD